MKVGALDHPKTKGLKARLQCSRAQVIGHLELLWAFTAQHAQQGDIGKWGDEEISEACDWQEHGERGPQFFVQALTEKGFIEKSEQHRLLIHDWHEHAPKWLKMQLANRKLPFLTRPPVDASTEASTGASTEASTGGSTGAPSSPSQAKPREKTKASTAAALPAWLDPVAWESWVSYRRECRKPMTPATVAKQLRFLEQHQADHVAIIDQSIRNGWQGLFELKGNNRESTGGHSAPNRVARANDKYR